MTEIMRETGDSVVSVLGPIMKKYKLSAINIAYNAGGDSYDGYDMHYIPAQESATLDEDAIAEEIASGRIATTDKIGNFMDDFIANFIEKTAPDGFETNDGSDGLITLVYNQQEDKFTLIHENTALVEQSFMHSGIFSATDTSDFDTYFVTKMADVLAAQKITAMDIHVSGIDSDGNPIFKLSPPLKDLRDSYDTDGLIRTVLRNGMGDDYTLDPETMNRIVMDINIKLDKQSSDPRVQYSIDIERDPTYDAPVTCFQKSYTGAIVAQLLKDAAQPSKPKSGVKP